MVKRTKLTPKQMIEKHPDSKAAKNFILDLVAELKAEKKTPPNIRNHVKLLRSWFSHNGIEIAGRIKVGKSKTVRVAKEVVPNQDELRRIMEAASLRAKVTISLMAFGGVRPQVLGNFLGDDGIRVGDFREMTIKDGKVGFKQTPTMFVIRETLSKAGHEYVSFLPPEGCRYLAEYLEQRIEQGEKLTPDSVLFTSDYAT